MSYYLFKIRFEHSVHNHITEETKILDRLTEPEDAIEVRGSIQGLARYMRDWLLEEYIHEFAIGEKGDISIKSEDTSPRPWATRSFMRTLIQSKANIPDFGIKLKAEIDRLRHYDLTGEIT